MKIKSWYVIIIMIVSGLIIGWFIGNIINPESSKLKPRAKMDKIIAVYIRKDSSKKLDILWRQINIDSFKDGSRFLYKVDTIWGYPDYLPILDSLGRPKIDSITKEPILNTNNPSYRIINKDSVNWKVEGKSLYELLKK